MTNMKSPKNYVCKVSDSTCKPLQFRMNKRPLLTEDIIEEIEKMIDINLRLK